jgi:PAS domain-containing protein
MKEGVRNKAAQDRTRQPVGIIVFGDHLQVRYANPSAQRIIGDPADDGDLKENHIKIVIAKPVAQLRECPDTSMISRILEIPDRHEPVQSSTGAFRVRAVQVEQGRKRGAALILVVIEPHQIYQRPSRSLIE